MKTISALFSSAIATVALTLVALLFSGCNQQPIYANQEDKIPVVPTTLVYSIDAPGAFDREEIAYSKPKSTKPETFKIEGKSSAISLAEAFEESDPAAEFAMANFEYDDSGDGLHGRSTNISILKAVTCHAVENHDPIDESSYFQSENGRVWLYSQVALPSGEAGIIQHVWKRNGEVQHSIALFVQGPTYRTSSFKTMNEKLAGDWTIEIATENGEVLEIVEFQVQ